MEGITSVKLLLHSDSLLLGGDFRMILTIVSMSLSHYIMKTFCMFNFAYFGWLHRPFFVYLLLPHKLSYWIQIKLVFKSHLSSHRWLPWVCCFHSSFPSFILGRFVVSAIYFFSFPAAVSFLEKWNALLSHLSTAFTSSVAFLWSVFLCPLSQVL